MQTVMVVGCYLANTLNMDQTPFHWEYLEGKSYGFKGSKSGYGHGDQGGVNDKQRYSSRFLPMVSIVPSPDHLSRHRTTPPPHGNEEK